VKNIKLAGIVIEYDFVDISYRLIKELSAEAD